MKLFDILKSKLSPSPADMVTEYVAGQKKAEALKKELESAEMSLKAARQDRLSGRAADVESLRQKRDDIREDAAVLEEALPELRKKIVEKIRAEKEERTLKLIAARSEKAEKKIELAEEIRTLARFVILYTRRIGSEPNIQAIWHVYEVDSQRMLRQLREEISKDLEKKYGQSLHSLNQEIARLSNGDEVSDEQAVDEMVAAAMVREV